VLKVKPILKIGDKNDQMTQGVLDLIDKILRYGDTGLQSFS
jgi:hypothetical protein